MRKEWFSAHVAAAVAAPLLLGLSAHQASAEQPASEAPKELAQAISSSTNTTESPAGSVTETSTTTATTTGTQSAGETGAPLGSADPAAASDLDSAAPVNEIGAGFDPDEPAIVPLGDDALPSLLDSQNNPYLRANTAGLAESGRTAGDQEYGAFVPPTDTSAEELRGTEAGSEMANILGQEVYNRRVNITTPPDTEVAEVIRLLAERANLNFVYGEGIIQGKVTLNLRDVPLGVALQSLLSSQDLAIVREGENVMRIAPRADVRPGKLDSRTVYIKLNWVQAETLAATLKASLGETGGGSVQPHKESNTIIITDTAPNVALLRDLVAQLDVPEKQVMIEARMVELLVSAGRQLGSQIDISRRDGSGNSPILDADGNELDGVISGLIGSVTNPRLGFGGVVSILGDEFNVGVALDGLESRNVVNTLANPRVITLNNQEAFIDITREIPYLEAQQGVTQGAVTASVKFKDAGVRLRVLPVITNNGYVRMKLEPEQEIQAGTITDPLGSAIPIIDRRSAITNVIVKDEDTAVLGGLRQIAALSTKAEFPWIGKTPILGWFFKRDDKSHLKNDLMLFVTPHIVKAPVLTAAENYKYSRVDAHWDLPDYFFDDSVDQREGRHRFEADMNPRNYYPQNLLLPPPDGAVGSVSEVSNSLSGLK